MVIAVRLAFRIVRVNEHDLTAGPAGQRPRLLVHRIAERVDGSPHPLARFGPHIVTVVEDSRHSDSSDARRFGHVVDRRIAPAHARSLAMLPQLRNGPLRMRECYGIVRTYARGSAGVRQ